MQGSRQIAPKTNEYQNQTNFKGQFEHNMRKPVFGFPTGSDTNQAVPPQKMVRVLKFLIKKEEGLHYLE